MTGATGQFAAGKLLVTGASGFVGRYVAEAVHGGRFGQCTMVAPPAGWDIRDAGAVDRFVAEAKPDCVLHMAAQSFVPQSFADPRGTLEINFFGTLNLLMALRASGFSGRMIYVSSGDIYGRVPEAELPVDEQRWPEPRSPYATSKVAAEQLCLQWHRTEALDVMVARPFNHVGPGQDPRFVLPALARQVVAIADGKQPAVIDAGDIDSTRDFTDVRDVVAAYAAILEHGIAGSTYVIGSGKETRVRDLLEAMCRLENINPEIRQNPAKLRASEQRRMVADASRLRRDTGWEPGISLDTALLGILKDARNNYEQ
jgi:GDP-4-dehydro-6-deoxy-D-mannose reductase